MADPDFKNIKILVIDDDELMRVVLRNSIQKLGCTVFEAQNGNEGIDMFKKERPDLTITDLLMPDKEGLETIKDLRILNPEVKIIAMSGGGSTQNMAFLQLAEKIGANYTMAKPIKPAELLNAVKKLLSV